VIHELPVVQAFALSACSAWASGYTPTNGAYVDWEVERELERINSKV